MGSHHTKPAQPYGSRKVATNTKATPLAPVVNTEQEWRKKQAAALNLMKQQEPATVQPAMAGGANVRRYKNRAVSVMGMY